MAWVYLTGPCACCTRIFNYNPHRVPSFRFDGRNREAICQACMLAINEARARKGLAPHPIAADAYEPIDEAEL